MQSRYPNLSSLLANSAYGKSPALSDVAIRSTALRLAVDSFDVEQNTPVDQIGGRAELFELFLRQGAEGVTATARNIRAREEAVKAKDGRIADLESALFAIGTAFDTWQKAVRTEDSYFFQETDLSAANAEFYATVVRVLGETPMPGETDDGIRVVHIDSLPGLFDMLTEVFGPPTVTQNPEPTSEEKPEPVSLRERLENSVPDCGNPGCLVHRPGGLLDTVGMATDAAADTSDEKPENNA